MDARELAVWSARVDGIGRAGLEALARSLSADEHATLARLPTEALRREYLVTRGLCRRALSETVPAVDPAAWRFERDAAGKPHVVGPRPGPPFNLSNSDGLVGCIVGAAPVGIDLEPVGRGDALLRIAAEIFSPAERDRLAALPLELRRAAAVELWTLKEAYLKARGSGLAVRLRTLELAPGAARPAGGWRPFHAAGAPEARLEVTHLGAGPDGFVLAVAALGNPPGGAPPRAPLVVRRIDGGIEAAGPGGVTPAPRG
jgi:4'-phosphopantetheinyl transferase